jgi:hypothetical protein
MGSTIPGAHRLDNRPSMQNFDTILHVFNGRAHATNHADSNSFQLLPIKATTPILAKVLRVCFTVGDREFRSLVSSEVPGADAFPRPRCGCVLAPVGTGTNQSLFEAPIAFPHE